MVDWKKLFCEHRRKDGENVAEETQSTKSHRTEIERDYDRILFLPATRRLADKTQVFPMEVNDSVRTRLTHSYEVSNLARSVGTRLAYYNTEIFTSSGLEDDFIKRNLPTVLASSGLIHDLGNPPFGHQGEQSISKWFTELSLTLKTQKVHSDFMSFDGNRQTIRLVSKLHVLNNDFGLDLTYGTLSAMIKYPIVSEKNGGVKYKKHGLYLSDQDLLDEVNKKVGLDYSHRNPLAFIMEACDDIAYSVIDAEDTVKKGYASFNDLVYWLESGIATEDDSKEKELVKEILVYIKKKNKEFREEKLSPGELNDISMQMFRVISISKLIDCVADSFVNVVRDEELYQSLEKSLASGKGLIEFSEGKLFCDLVKAFDFTYGYTNREVLKLELRGDRIIRDVLDMIWLGVSAVSYNKEKNKINLPEDRFARFAYNSISENYRRRFTTALEQGKQDEIYNKCHLVCDFISGMTEKFLMSYHDELKALQTS